MYDKWTISRLTKKRCVSLMTADAHTHLCTHTHSLPLSRTHTHTHTHTHTPNSRDVMAHVQLSHVSRVNAWGGGAGEG